MKGDEAERSDKTKQRRAALLERILARQNEKKSKFDAKNEEQLKSLSTAVRETNGEVSPVSVAAMKTVW